MVRPVVPVTMRVLIVGVVAVLAGCATFDSRTPERQPSPPPGQERERPSAEEPRSEINGGMDRDRERAAPQPLEEQHPSRLVDVSGPAVVSLHQQAEQEHGAGRPDNAVAVLERALRIEPRNPFLWASLAEAHLANGDPLQAENTASRANSLARSNPHLEYRNWRTIAEARQALGNDGGARDASDRAENAQLRIRGI